MKTSASQFVMMVTFMDQYGDLSKLSYTARGRITSFNKWEELARILNSDGSGDSKTVEKWKKVWSDLKNNIKKKVSRLHKAACGTGGGPAVLTKLTDLEQRVLNLIGMRAAVGVALEEAGLPQTIHQTRLTPEVNVDEVCISPFLPPSTTISSPPMLFVEEKPQNLNQPSTSFIAPTPTSPPVNPPSAFVEVQIEEVSTLSPARSPSEVHVLQPEPALSGQTTPRRVRPTRIRGSPRRQARLTGTEQATQTFLQADSHWRELKEKQHRDFVRIWEIEVQTQREWQTIVIRTLDILDKIANKFCRE